MTTSDAWHCLTRLSMPDARNFLFPARPTGEMQPGEIRCMVEFRVKRSGLSLLEGHVHNSHDMQGVNLKSVLC